MKAFRLINEHTFTAKLAALSLIKLSASCAFSSEGLDSVIPSVELQDEIRCSLASNNSYSHKHNIPRFFLTVSVYA